MASRRVLKLFSSGLLKKDFSSGVTLCCRSTSVSPCIQKRLFYQQHYEGIVEADPSVRGIELLRDPYLNKGMAFTLLERQIMGIHGLLPPVVFSQDEQAERVMKTVNQIKSSLDTYIYLIALQDRNEKLFYKVLCENVEQLAPIVYTPTVGKACENFGFIFRKPRGLYITINDIGNIYRVLSNWPERNIKAICVTDGERILGLGDLGAFGMGIPVGKLSLYTAMAGVPPRQCLPIFLDVGTDNDKLLNQQDYIGLRHKRVRGHRYLEFMDEFMEAVEKRFGVGTLVQFEDFAYQNAFPLLERYRDKYLTFNDDIQGTASVVVAGLLAAMKELNSSLREQTILFYGAGSAALGIANLATMAMVEEGLSKEEARQRIWMIDINGLLTNGRRSGLTTEQLPYGKDCEDMRGLLEITKKVKPTMVLGASACPGAFSEEFIREMTKLNERPVIFALSNPTRKAECTAEQAYTYSEGKCLFASGSPFPPVTYNGKTYYPGQGNNAYIFPGVALGAILSGAHHVPDGMFLRASQALADMVTPENFAEGRLFPPLSDIRDVSAKLATRIVTYAYNHNMASRYPEPEDHEAFVRAHQYDYKYGCFVPHTYAWPGMPLHKL